jgi:hypothetical protein
VCCTRSMPTDDTLLWIATAVLGILVGAAAVQASNAIVRRRRYGMTEAAELEARPGAGRAPTHDVSLGPPAEPEPPA